MLCTKEESCEEEKEIIEIDILVITFFVKKYFFLIYSV